MSGLQTDVMSNTTHGLLYCLYAISAFFADLEETRLQLDIQLYASRVSSAAGLEPHGELPCWPCSHLPVTKRRGRTARGEHGQPISRSCDSKTHRSCWPGRELSGGDLSYAK